MPHDSLKTTNHQRSIRFAAVSILIALFLVVSCGKARPYTSPAGTSSASISVSDGPTMYFTKTLTIPTQTPTATQFPKSKPLFQTPTNHANEGYTITATQMPIVVQTDEPADSKYLYKYAIVTFTSDSRDGENYLNLDNLYDNEAGKVDIVFTYSSGSGGTFYYLYPVNGATLYYSDLHAMSYETCMQHYPFTNMDVNEYDTQGFKVGSGRDFCVITNEGRLSIVRLAPESLDVLSADYELRYPEFVVTTYSQVIPQVKTPFAATFGPSPTPSNYSGWNLTNDQIIGLNRAGQKFLDAVVSGDKDTIEKMLDYPVYVDIEIDEKTTDSFHVNNKEEFLAAYSKIFTSKLIQEFAEATVDENMGPNYGSIFLVVPDCAVFFHPDGRISQISVSTVWWQDRE